MDTRKNRLNAKESAALRRKIKKFKKVKKRGGQKGTFLFHSTAQKIPIRGRGGIKKQARFRARNYRQTIIKSLSVFPF